MNWTHGVTLIADAWPWLIPLCVAIMIGVAVYAEWEGRHGGRRD